MCFFSTLSSGMFDKLKMTVWTELTGHSTGHSSELTLTLSSLMVELLTQVFKSGHMALLSGLSGLDVSASRTPQRHLPNGHKRCVCVALKRNPSEHVCLWSKCSPLCRHAVLTRLA